MAVTTDILQSYRNPAGVFRRKLAAGVDEGRALSVLMAASGLIFVSQWPGIARTAHLDPTVPFDARIGGALMATLFFLPLLAYGLAALSHVVARAFGGRGSFVTARMALFWALLTVSPLMLLQGLVRGLIGASPALTATGIVVLLAFLVIWGTALVEAERGTWT